MIMVVAIAVGVVCFAASPSVRLFTAALGPVMVGGAIYFGAIDPPPKAVPGIANVALREDVSTVDLALAAVAMPMMRWEVQDYIVVKYAAGGLRGSTIHMIGIAGKWYLV